MFVIVYTALQNKVVLFCLTSRKLTVLAQIAVIGDGAGEGQLDLY